jgi:hypothetical protein
MECASKAWYLFTYANRGWGTRGKVKIAVIGSPVKRTKAKQTPMKKKEGKAPWSRALYIQSTKPIFLLWWVGSKKEVAHLSAFSLSYVLHFIIDPVKRDRGGVSAPSHF